MKSLKIIPSIRKTDAQGSGYYGAPRGSRTHKGIDVACYPDSEILSVCNGVVTKIGYPYDPEDIKKGHLRYVQVTTPDKVDERYFYVRPTVEVGDTVIEDDVLGVSQDLRDIYPGITPHYHWEIKRNNVHIDPNDYLESL